MTAHIRGAVEQIHHSAVSLAEAGMFSTSMSSSTTRRTRASGYSSTMYIFYRKPTQDILQLWRARPNLAVKTQYAPRYIISNS